MSGLITLDEAEIEALTGRALALEEEVATFGPLSSTGDGGDLEAFARAQKHRVAELVDSGSTRRAAWRACPGTGVGYSQMAALLANRERHGDRALDPYAIRAKKGSSVKPKMADKVRELLKIGLTPTPITRHPDIIALICEHGPGPTRDQVRYLRDHLPPLVAERKPGSPSLQSESLSSVSKAFYGGRPLAYVEADGTVHDLVAQTDDDSELTLRPRDFIVADLSIHGPLAVDPLPADGDQLDVQELIAMLILPKDAVTKEAGCTLPWLPHGIPDMFAVDRGKQFIARSVIRLSWRVGMVIVAVGAGMPFRKPFVEQINAEIHQGFDSRLASWTGNSHLSRPDRGAHRAAVLHGITIPDVKSGLIRYVAEEFNESYHDACAGTPNQAWIRGRARYPLRTWLGDPAALRAMCRVDYGVHKLTKNGVWIHGHWFGNPPVRDADETADDRPFSVAPGARPRHLRDLRKRQAEEGLEGFRIFGRLDDMRWVELCDEQGNRLAMAVCHQCEALGRPVPDWEVQAMRAEARRRKKATNGAVTERRVAAAATADPSKPARRRGKSTTPTTRADAKAAQRADRAVRHQPSLDDPYEVGPAPAPKVPKARRRKARALPFAPDVPTEPKGARS